MSSEKKLSLLDRKMQGEWFAFNFPSKLGGSRTLRFKAVNGGGESGVFSPLDQRANRAFDRLDCACCEQHLTPCARSSARATFDLLLRRCLYSSLPQKSPRNDESGKAKSHSRSRHGVGRCNAADVQFAQKFTYLAKEGKLDKILNVEDRMASSRRSMLKRHKEEIEALRQMQAAEMNIIMQSGEGGVESLVEVHVQATQQIERERAKQIAELELAQRKSFASEVIMRASTEQKRQEAAAREAASADSSDASGTSIFESQSNWFAGLSLLGGADALTTLAEKGVSFAEEKTHWTEGILLEGLDEVSMNDRALKHLTVIDAFVGTQLRIPFRVHVRSLDKGIFGLLRPVSSQSLDNLANTTEERKWSARLLYSSAALCGVLLPRDVSGNTMSGLSQNFVTVANASAELHFEGLSSQLKYAQESDEGGDIIVTRHSNILGAHCAFHVPHRKPHSFDSLARAVSTAVDCASRCGVRTLYVPAHPGAWSGMALVSLARCVNNALTDAVHSSGGLRLCLNNIVFVGTEENGASVTHALKTVFAQ